MGKNHSPGFNPETATHKQWMRELYGKEEGDNIVKRQTKVKQIMDEAKALVEKRWKEEFPEEDCSGKEKPWGSAWFNARPPY